MKFIIDTNIFIWWINNDSKLTKSIINKIEDAESIFVSIASVWEILIKSRIGKLTLTESDISDFIQSQLRKNQFYTLSIELKHVLEINNLESFHEDPFDRVIISQSRVEKLPILTSDKIFKKYKVELL